MKLIITDSWGVEHEQSIEEAVEWETSSAIYYGADEEIEQLKGDLKATRAFLGRLLKHLIRQKRLDDIALHQIFEEHEVKDV